MNFLLESVISKSRFRQTDPNRQMKKEPVDMKKMMARFVVEDHGRNSLKHVLPGSKLEELVKAEMVRRGIPQQVQGVVCR